MVVGQTEFTERLVWIGFVSKKRQSPTAASRADGRKACDDFYKTVPAMIANWGLGRGVGCGMLGSAGGRGAETCLQPSLSIDQLWWVIFMVVGRRVESSIMDLTGIVFKA